MCGLAGRFHAAALAPDPAWAGRADELRRYRGPAVAERGFLPQLDRQACYDFLGRGYVPEPATGFANVCALPPGSVLTITPEGTRLAGYDRVVATPRAERRLEDTVEALADRLLTAVRRQSVADVPVAALLSRGVDSPLVLATHERAGLGPTSTFNVRFPDKEHTETDVPLAAATQCR